MNLNGTLPCELGDLKFLQYLTIRHNPLLTGTIPPGFGNAIYLSSLQLDENNLIGNIPSQLGNLFNLSH